LSYKILNAFLISTGCGTTAAKTIFATAIVLIIFTTHSRSAVFFSLLYPYLGCSIHVITLFPSSVAFDRKKMHFKKKSIIDDDADDDDDDDDYTNCSNRNNNITNNGLEKGRKRENVPYVW